MSRGAAGDEGPAEDDEALAGDAAAGVTPSNALDAFTREATSLSAEHRRLMDARHRAVRWEASTAGELPADLRAGLGELWSSRVTSEHRSIGVFSLFTLDLLGAGAPAEYLSLACRGALDEVRHAELFARLTALYTGETPTPPAGIPQMPDDPSISMREQVAFEALHLSAFSETYSAVLLSALHDRARDPVVRDVLGVVVADEIYHARMGWALLGQLLAPGAPDADALRARVQSGMVEMLDALVETMFGDPRTIPPSSVAPERRALAEGHGYMSARDEYALFRATVHDVWLPGLASLGLDPRALADRYPAIE